MAIGNGSKLPLVMSTSIKEKAGLVRKNNIKRYKKFFFTYPLNISVGSKFNCISFHFS